MDPEGPKNTIPAHKPGQAWPRFQQTDIATSHLLQNILETRLFSLGEAQIPHPEPQRNTLIYRMQVLPGRQVLLFQRTSIVEQL